MEIFYASINWLDLLWIPAALLALHKGQRLKAVLFVLACALMLRLQIQLMDAVGYPNGFLGLMSADLYTRGLITYSVFILGFFLLSYASPKVDNFVFVAASISTLIAAFCVSLGIMAL